VIDLFGGINVISFTAEYLRSILHYDPETGEWTWIKKTSRKVVPGRSAGTDDGHRKIIGIEGEIYPSSILAWLYMTGEWPPLQVDHVDRNSANDRWVNLRLATNQQNNMNKGLRKTNTSGVTGVSWFKNKQKWRAQICVNGHISLGYYADFDDACQARWDAEDKYFGEFAPKHPPLMKDLFT
jgi:hypothetical protein